MVKITEIYDVAERDEFLEPHTNKFYRAKTVAKWKQLILRKNFNNGDIYYGVFEKKHLIAMLWLTRRKEKFQVVLIQVAQSYRGQGLGTLLVDYAVMDDSLMVLSDNRQTPQAKKMWSYFGQIGHFKIYPYDLKTDTIVADLDWREVYKKNDNLVLLAMPPGKTINESLTEINKKYNGARKIVWYGSGGEDFFNW